MGFKHDSGLFAAIRHELISTLLERVQGSSMKAVLGDEPEINDPKAIYEAEEILSLPYVNCDGVPLAMDIFKPAAPEAQALPVIVNIHGDGLIPGDRTVSHRYARVLARRGYLVFSIAYRLAPRANAAEQLDDVCAGLDAVSQHLGEFRADRGRMYLTADSAGAFPALYAAAMKESEALQDAVGHAPTALRFQALGLISGIIYTNKPDPIGMMSAEQYYGDVTVDPAFFSYLDPEDPEILDNLPPTFLVTSRGDFLNNYSLMYHKALKQAGKKTRLIYYGEKELGHSFVTMHPELPQSLDALDRMTTWFEEQADSTWENDNPEHGTGKRKISRWIPGIAVGVLCTLAVAAVSRRQPERLFSRDWVRSRVSRQEGQG